MTQHLRLSQYVITWGPGAILEGTRGPRIILDPYIGLFDPQGLNPKDFEITDKRMSVGLLKGNRIFELPSNAKLGRPHDVYIYRTNPFPQWKLCHNRQEHHSGLHEGFSVLFSGRCCPICHSEKKEHMEPIRFVMACPNGHLDDVDWYKVVHGSSSSCGHVRWFMWFEKGSSIRDIEIMCPRCGKRTNMGWAYGKKWDCSGRYPEKERTSRRTLRQNCKQRATIVQRQASNLRIPEIRTLFTIPPLFTVLHQLLQKPAVYDALVANPPKNRNELEKMLGRLAEAGRISWSLKEEILSHPWEEIKLALQEVQEPIKQNYRDLLLEEFRAFIEGSIRGIPPIRGPRRSSPILLEINPHKVFEIEGENGKRFKVTPIPRLRTVIVQIGYRREVDPSVPAEIVDVSFPDPSLQTRWYPGTQFFGEGIFITLSDNNGWMDLENESEDVASWLDAWQKGEKYPPHVFRDPQAKDELHPAFVWWHTLSHLLIRSISIEAGYSSASIRERIYVEISERGARGGILLYATQPGSEGTFGGLVALASKERFSVFFSRATSLLLNCSSDPLCYESKFSSGRYCGSACYACLFLSETSCEHRNMWLDRRVLRSDPP